MTRIIMHGCNGKMGQVITEIVAGDPDAEIVAGIDITGEKRNDYPVFADLKKCEVLADAVIDFSSYKATDELLAWCDKKKLPLVLCTTGLSESQIEKVKEYSKSYAILRSANMSLGINMLLKELKNVANVLAPAGFDIEIVEKHHNQKLDAPSGTAIALAESINESLNMEYNYKYDRTLTKEKRDPKEIGISAVRGGSIVGEHEVIFAGRDEVVTITHTAYSKAIFANGAVEAAKFMKGKPAGLYDMGDVIG